MSETGDKRFPVLQGGGRTISWETAQYAYTAYIKRYGDRQTLERLADRGGFAESELDVLYPQWRETETLIGRLQAENALLRQQLQEAQMRQESLGWQVANLTARSLMPVQPSEPVLLPDSEQVLSDLRKRFAAIDALSDEDLGVEIKDSGMLPPIHSGFDMYTNKR